MKLSDYVVQKLYELTQCEHVFTLTGGMAMHLIESFGSSKKVKVITTHHEQAAGIAASCYARVKEVPSMVLVTAGPGALNAVTPCGGAYMESIPMIFISGQVSVQNSTLGMSLRQRGVQEVEIVEVVKSITKYAVKITDPLSVRKHLEKGIKLATEGRPGPVWFDIPVDIQGATIEPDKLQPFEEIESEAMQTDFNTIDNIIDSFQKANRPLLVLGHGIRLAKASSMVRDLVELLDVPFQTTWNGMDLIDASHPLNFGRANLFGPRYANLIIQNADFILSIGARWGLQHTGYNVEAFARGATIASIDVDVHEMSKIGLNIDHKIVLDAGIFIKYLLDNKERFARKTMHGSWIQKCIDLEKRFPIAPSLSDVVDDNYVNPHYFMNVLSGLMPSNAVFPFGSSGMGHTLTGGIFRCKQGQRVFTFKGLASMGYGLPCVIGAAIAEPNRPAFTLVGEGGLQLNLQELQTAVTYKLPIKVIIFNNGGYHSIHMTQKNFFNGHFVGSGPESGVTFPNLKELSDLYKMNYYMVDNNRSLETDIQSFISDPVASFLEVFIDPDKALEPKLISMKLPDGRMVSRPLEDMSPLLERTELQNLMDIPLIKEFD